MEETRVTPAFTDEDHDRMQDAIRAELEHPANTDIGLSPMLARQLRLHALGAVNLNLSAFKHPSFTDEDRAHVDHLVQSAMWDVLDGWFPLP